MAIFDHAHPKIIESTICTSMQKISLFHLFILQIQSFQSPALNLPHPSLTMLTPKFFNYLLVCVNLCQHAKKSVNFICSFWRYSQFQSPETRLATSIFDHSQPKIFDQLLIFVNLYQHAKNQAVSWIYSGKIVGLKILKSDWLRPFWPISQDYFNIGFVQEQSK